MLTNPQIGDRVRYSTSANRAYGFTKAARQRQATIVAILGDKGDVITIRWDNGGGDRNMASWQLQPAKPQGLPVLERMLGDLFKPE